MKNDPSPRASSARRPSKPPPPAPDTSAAARERAEATAQAIDTEASSAAVSPVDARTRAYAALLAAAHGPDDNEEMFDAVCDRRETAYRLLTGSPAISPGDVARKLAVLVTEMLRLSSGEPDAEILMLTASALADAVLLDSGPLPAKPADGVSA